MVDECVACVGAGPIGLGWAIAFARRGYRTRLFDQSSDVVRNGLEIARRRIKQLEQHSLIESADQVFARIEPASSLEAAVADASYLQESITEQRVAKRELFQQLATCVGPDTILASSTSEIPGSQFLCDLGVSARCLVAHPVNPPYLVPLVELCPTPQTDPATVHASSAFLSSAGFAPIVIRKEICGFVLNRLQLALVAEALQLVAEGYCSAADVDRALTMGLGRRWVFMGPFETGHLNANGYADYMIRFREPIENIMRDLRPRTHWDDSFVRRIEEEVRSRIRPGEIEAGRHWRDGELMALERFLRARTGACTQES